MTNITFDYFKCDDLVKLFGKKEMEEKWNSLFIEMNEFLEINNVSSYAFVDKILLSNAIIDFYVDIKRLQDFSKIKKINSQKTIAYTAYWLLRRKPIQIINNQGEIEDIGKLKGLATLNERFVLQFILTYLSVRVVKSTVLERSEVNKGIENFCGTLLYFLIYRLRDAQSLEMVLVAFLAGQLYENEDDNLGNDLHFYDHDEKK